MDLSLSSQHFPPVSSWSSKDLILSAFLHTLGRKSTLRETMHKERPSYLQGNRMAKEGIKHFICYCGQEGEKGLITKVCGEQRGRNTRTKGKTTEMYHTHAKREVDTLRE